MRMGGHEAVAILDEIDRTSNDGLGASSWQELLAKPLWTVRASCRWTEKDECGELSAVSKRAVRRPGELGQIRRHSKLAALGNCRCDGCTSTTVTTRQHTATYPQTAMFYATELPLDVASATCY